MPDYIRKLNNSNKKDELVKVLKQARKALYAARVDVLTCEGVSVWKSMKL